MSDSQTSMVCPKCRGALPSNAPRGLCTKCLIAGLLEAGPLEAPPPSAPSEPALPRTFGAYELLKEVGRGGMGIVYRAHQKQINRFVALKMLRDSHLATPRARQRFQIEAEAAARLDHPNIVPIYEFGTADGQPFISMKLVEGRSLSNQLHGTPMAAKAAARLMATLARAVHYAHQRGILHRDLKPANILLDARDEPQVTDFGLAKRLDLDSGPTLSSDVIGSPNYMAPEQAAGHSSQVTTAADVYSLGAIMYELLTGRAPFRSDTPLETIRKVIEEEPIAPRLMYRFAEPDLETICLKCMQKEPARRYSSAEALAEDLERWLNGLAIQARTIGRAERTWMWCRRNPVQAVLVSSLVVALAGGFGGVFGEWRRAEAARRIAEMHESLERRHAYAADIQLAQRALDDNNIGRARELLKQQRPAPGKEDLRGWDWRYLWEQCRSDALFALGHTDDGITDLSPSPDGKWVAVVDGARRLRLWNLAEREAASVARIEGTIFASFSPTEPLLGYTTSLGNPFPTAHEAHLWSAVSRQEVRHWNLPGLCRAMAFSADGRRLVTMFQEPHRELAFWNVADGRLLTNCPIPGFSGGYGTPFASGGNGPDIAMATLESTIVVINADSGNVVVKIQNVTTVTALALSPDGALLAAGFHGERPGIALYELPAGRELRRMAVPVGYPVQLRFAHDGNTLFSAGSDQTIQRLVVSNLQPARVLRGHSDSVTRMAVLPGDDLLVSGSGNGELLGWDAGASPPNRAVCKVASPGCYSWFFTPDNKGVVLNALDGNVIRLLAPAFNDPKILLALGTNLYDSRLSEDCRWAAASDREGTIRVWDLADGSLRAEVTSGSSMAAMWQFTEDGKRLLVIHCNDQSLHELDLAANKYCSARQGLAAWRVHRSFPNGFLGRSVGRDVISKWYPNSLPLCDQYELAHIFSGAFTTDEMLFAKNLGTGRIALEKDAPWRQVAEARAVLQSIHSVAFSQNGLIAIGSDNREAVKLWQIDGFHELLSLPGEGSNFLLTRFSPDGNLLGSMSRKGLLHIWRAPSWEEIAASERLTQ